MVSGGKMKRTSSFKQYIERSSSRLTHSLLQKAYAANRLAKTSRGFSRSRLYEVKYRYLSRAIEVMPDSFYIDSLIDTGTGVILGIKSSERFEFHIPATKLSSPARKHLVSALLKRRNTFARKIERPRQIAA
jgi:hypothetical protein